jgi:hypothetical protein
VQAHFHFLERLAHHDVALLKQLFSHLQAHPAQFDQAHRGTLDGPLSVLISLASDLPFPSLDHAWLDLVGALFADLQHLGGLSHLTLTEPIKDVWTILWNLPWPSAVRPHATHLYTARTVCTSIFMQAHTSCAFHARRRQCPRRASSSVAHS